MPNNDNRPSNPHLELARLASLNEARSRLRRGFPGLTKVFRGVQERLISEFRSTMLIDHPGDVGTARETLLRDFLTKHNLLPNRYGITRGSSHVLSSSGHISKQVDLLIYDSQSAPKLLSFGDVGYFPIECCYGLIEAKSNLSSEKLVHDGLAKISSYKQLKVRRKGQLAAADGFGILVAHTSSLAWSTLIESVREWESDRSSSEWPNLVVVLDKGVIGHSSRSRLVLGTADLGAAADAQVETLDINNDALLCFYLCLIDLLNGIVLPPTSLHDYVWLPTTAGKHSYAFDFGVMDEVGSCPDHGHFLHHLSEEVIGKILEACPIEAECDVGAALDEAYGDMSTRSLAGTYGRASIYNPEGHPLSRVLVRPCNVPMGPPGAWTLSMAFVSVTIDERRFVLPRFYVARHGLLGACPKCKSDNIPEFTIEQWWDLWMRSVEHADQTDQTDRSPGEASE